MFDPHRNVVDGADGRPSVEHMDVQHRDEAVLRFRGAAGGSLIRDQVAFAIHDEPPGDLLDRLHHVDVLTDDDVDQTVPEEIVGDGELLLVGRVHVLVSPMEVHDDELRALPPGAPGIRHDPWERDDVVRPRVWQRQPVVAVGVGEERHLHPVHVDRRDPLRFGGRASRAGVSDALSVERVEGRVDAELAPIDRVRRGGRTELPPRPPDGGGQLDGRVEDRIPGKRPRSDRRFHVADGEGGAPDDGPDLGEHRPEIVVAVPECERTLVDGAVDEEIPAGDDGEVVDHRRSRRRGRRRSGGEHGAHDRRRLRDALGSDPEDQAPHQHDGPHGGERFGHSFPDPVEHRELPGFAAGPVRPRPGVRGPSLGPLGRSLRLGRVPCGRVRFLAEAPSLAFGLVGRPGQIVRPPPGSLEAPVGLGRAAILAAPVSPALGSAAAGGGAPNACALQLVRG